MESRAYHSVLFIDAGVADAQALLAGTADGVLVVHLEAGTDGVQQIAAALQGLEGLDSIQILSHGAVGHLQLGSGVLNAARLQDDAALLQQWGSALREGGDLLLYGCDVAQGSEGLAFIDALADLTGADVAASSDATGSSLLGANWILERSSGSGAIEAASALSQQAQQDYGHTLALVNNGAAGTITFNTNSDVSLLNASGLGPGAVVNVSNILNTGLDVYAQSSNGGGVAIVNANGTSLLGVPLNDDRLTVNGSLLSPVNYVDLRANSGVFDMVSLKLGSGNLVGNLLGNTVFTVYALDANYQPTGVGVSLLSLVVNEYGLLNFASMANFKGIYGVRIVNPLGFEVGIDDVQVANGRVAPSVSSAAYNAGTGVLNITTVGLTAGDAVDPTKLTISGQGGSYTLTSPAVAAASGTSVSITLNAADKLALGGVLNQAGASAVDGTVFNVAAAAGWTSNVSSAFDLTGNAITVSNVQLPTITSASYDATSHVLTVTGANLVKMVGAANDITVSQLVLRGEGGVTRALSTTGNVEINSATSFSVTLSGADLVAITTLLNKNGTAAAGGVTYQLSAGDDWNSVIGNTNTAVAGVGVVVTNTTNSAPTINGAAAASTGDNASLTPFANVTVADANGDNVSLSISYNGANGTLSGTGLSGSAGSYTMSATTPAALSALLKALTFTPTANQAAVGVNVATTFSLTATDSNGAASAVNTATVVTATSVNDAPVVAGTAAGQGVTAGGTVRPFSAVTLSDPDVGASVILTITPDSASKGVFTPASLSASGFITTDGGATYTHTAAAPGAAQAALQSLVFQSTPGMNATTTFTLSVNDGSVIVSNSTTTVQAAVPSSTTALTVAFSNDTGVSNSDLITTAAAQNLSGTLSTGLLSGERVEVSLDNGVSWTNASANVGATSWQLAGQTLSGAGTLQVRVTNNGGSSTPLSASYKIDNTAPTTTNGGVSFLADTGNSNTDLVTRTAAQTVSGTLSANLAADEHVEVSFNNGSSWTTASASTGSNSWTLNGVVLSNGSNSLQVRVVDAAGNAGTANSTQYVLDTSGPSATLGTNVSVVGAGQAVPVTVSFTERPYGLTLASFNGVGGTVSNLQATADPLVYTIDYTPTAGIGNVIGSVQLVAGSYTDLAGNSGSAAVSQGVAVTLGPTVVITSSTPTLNIGQSATLTFSFSSTPVGFTTSDIVVSGGALSNLTNQGNGIYTAVFTPGANVTGPASITVTGGSYTDALNLPGGSGVSPVIAIDTRAPTLAITSSANALKIGDTATITFTFSEAVLDFDASDVTVINGALTGLAVTANPLVYTALLTPTNGVASGAVTVSVASGSYTDAAPFRNSGIGSPSPSISIDTVAPAAVGTGVSFSQDGGASTTDLITNSAAQTISGTLGTALATGDVVQVSLDNGLTWVNASAAVGASSWSLAGQTLVAGPGQQVQVRVSDAAGNHSATFSAAYVLDTTAPSVAVTSSAASLRVGESATITFTFSEAPVNFTTASLSVTGGVVSALAGTASPLVFTAQFTPAAGQAGASASIAVNSGGYSDTAGNSGQASAALPITLNTSVPTLTITSNDSALAVGETAQITFTFSSAPVGFVAGDVVVSNGTLTGLVATANPLVYTAQFTPDAGLNNASATVTVAAGAYADAAGNLGNGGAVLPIAIDTLAPSVVITSSTAAVKAGETAQITFTFSEAPIGFTSSDVVTTGGTLSGLVAVNGNPLVYTALFTPAAGIQNTSASITLVPGAFTDAAGNASVASVTPPLAIDTQAPTAIANTVLFSADTGASATDLITNTAAQTISGTVGTLLGVGEFVEVSLDNGANWASATTIGNAWSLAGQTLVASNVLQVRVTDAAGNHGAAFSRAYVLDTTAPTASVSASTGSLKSGETALVTFTFSEAPTGFTATDLTASGGTLSGFAATANPLVYTVVFTPTAGVNSGSGVVSINANSYQDTAGNNGGAASLPAIAIDTQAPTTLGTGVTFSADSGASNTDLVTNVAAQTIGGTLGANLVSGETVEVSLNNGLSWVAATASTGSNSWSLANQTLSAGPGQQVQVRVSDAVGNHGAVVSTAYTLDQSPPTLTITTSKTGLNSADTPLITFTFSEAPQNFNANSIITGGGALSGFSATLNPLVYTAVFTPTANQASGVGTVQVSPGSYSDAAGNAGLGATVAPISYATVAPGISISSDVSALRSGETANITFRFSSEPQGFVAGDVAASGGTLSGFAGTGDPLIYTAQFTPTAGVAQGTAAISVASNAFTDVNGNAGVGGAMLPISIDTLAPTLAITSTASALNGGSTALITFTFSEAPATFTLGDIGVTNGSLSNLVQTANPAIYTAVLTPAANLAGGNAVISVAAGAYADLAGNAGGVGTGPSISVDTLAPTLVNALLLFSNDTGNNTDRVTSIATQNIAGDLAGGVLAPGDVVEVSLDNGASWQSASAAAGGTGWVLTGQTLANGSGNVQVRVSDSNGNHGMVNSYAYVLDTTAPTVSITSDSTALRAGQSATISFTFSEAPTGFTLGDLIATGGSLSNFTATANPQVYTVVLTPTPGLTGSASVTLGNGLYFDLAGNSGSGGSSPSITVDTVVPTLSIGTSSNSLKVGDTATITFTFSDVPSGFSLGDITASNGALSNLVASPGGLVYTATFTPAAGTASANAVISVAAGLYNDAVGNLGAGASSAAIAIDTVAPTNTAASIAFSADTGADFITNIVAQTVTGTLTTPLAAGERVEVSLDNGATWSTALTTGPAQWALAPQVLVGSSTLQVRVADTAGNTGPVVSQNYVLDLTAPTVAVTSSASALRAGETATITFTFSEVPSGFVDSDLTVLNGTLGPLTITADPRVYTVVLTPDAGLAGAAASVTLAPGRYTDLAGNPGAGATSPLITVDSAPPVLQITTSASSLSLSQQATINFTFSEAPVGFTFGDVNVTGGVLSGFGLTANPLVYTAIFTPTQGVSSGTATIGVAGGYTDAAGNPGGVATLAPITYNTQPPSTGAATVRFSSDTGISNTDLITLNPIQTISGTLNSPLAAGEIVEVSLDNGVSWIIAGPGGVGADWALPTPTLLSGSGVVQVRVTDGVGNHGAVWSSSYTIDTTAPAVTIASSVAVLKAGDSATITFTFSEEPQGFISSDVSAVGGSITSFGVSANPRVYTAVFTPTPGYSGAASVSLAPASYTDKAGNAGLGGAVPAISVDAQAPTLLITSSLAQLKAGDSAQITFTFSETPVGFAVGDVTVSGGTLSGFAASVNPLVYTAVFTPTPGLNAGVASVSVAPAVYSDAAGNSGGAGVSPTINFDTLAPLAAASGSPSFSQDTGASATDLITSVAAQTVSGNLSLAPAAGETVQVSFDNGATWQQASVSGASWTLAHTLTGAGVLRVRVSDTAGNHSPETVHTYAFDQAAPSVAISSNVPVANGVTPAVITFTFSETPVGFSAANVAVSGGQLGALTATSDPRVFTASFTPTSGVANGSASIAVTGGYTDVAGNNGGAANIPSLQIDTVAPVAAATGSVQFSNDSGTAGDLITNNPAQSISGTLNAPLAAGDVVQVSLNGGQTWIQASVNGLNWNLPGQTLPGNGSGTLVVRVADAAGNFSTAQSLPFIVDTTAPTITISAGTTTVAPGEGITVTFTLSDPGVLTAGNIVVSNGTLSNFSGSGTTYTAILTPSGTASASISVPGQLFNDLAGNPNQASAPLVVAVGPAPTAPTAPGQPSTVDGVQIVTQSGVDGRTGVITRTVTVPTITAVRNEDQTTSHATLADIPLGIAANAIGVGSTLTVSLPVGIGFEASGPAELLGGSMALTDLIGRIDDHTAVGDPVRTAMEAQAREFMAGQGAGELEQHGTLRLSGVGAGADTWLLVTGDTTVQGGTLPMGGMLAGASPMPLSSSSSSSSVSAAATPANAEIALVIDARSLSGAGIELDNVDFAAIIGGARVQGGDGKNFVIGDDAAQHITLTAGTDNDTLYGNGGNDILGTAGGNDYLNGGDGNDILFAGAGNDVLVGGAGNDVLQGGRTDSGQWRFYLRADGAVEGVHQLALFDTTSTEILSGAELNDGVARLGFAGATADRLETLALLYHAAFDREPDLAGLSFWSAYDLPAQRFATDFLGEPESRSLVQMSNQDYVSTLLRHTLDRAPTVAEVAQYVARLDAAPGNIAVRGDVLVDIALTDAHKAVLRSADGVALGSELLTQEQGWIAGSGDDRLEAGSGSNLLVGGDGIDTAVFDGAVSNYQVVLSSAADVMLGQSAAAMNTVRQIELGEFGGVTLDLGFTQAATATLQEIGMLYQLTLDRAGDYTGFVQWLESGLHGVALASGFTRSSEFVNRYGALDDAAFVTQMYQNVTNAAPDSTTLARWDAYLDTHSREELVAQLAGDATLVGVQYGSNGLGLIGSW